MKKILVIAACVMMAACGTKESNSTEKVENVQTVSTKKPEMTPEEEAIAQKFGAVKAKDMGNGFFKVAKHMPAEDLDSLVYSALEEGAHLMDSDPLVWGVVDSTGWVVPAEYQSIERSIGHGAFVVSYTEWVKDWSGDYDYYDENRQIKHPWRYQQLCAVYYDGKIVAGWGTGKDFEPVAVSDRVYGFMYKVNGYYFWYPLGNDNTYNHYLEVINWTTPYYNTFEVMDGKLNMWDTSLGKSFAEAKSNSQVPEEEKSVMTWDLRKGKCTYNPFVPTD